MTEAEFQIAKSTGFVFALGFGLILQRISPHRSMSGSWRPNSQLWMFNAIIMAIVCAGCACTVSHWASGAGIGLFNQAAMSSPVSSWLAVPVCVLGMDFISYFWHRANHAVPFLWRFHQAHHSDVDFTVTTALRFHPAELLLALPLRLVGIVVLGVPIAGVIIFEVIFAIANFCEHGNINLPRKVERALGRVVVTPALHRRHHSREARLLNTNYATIFSFWDRLLGSYGESTSDIPVSTGLPGIEHSLKTSEILWLPARGVFRGS